MGYGTLARKRKVQTEHTLVAEEQFDDHMIVCKVPIYNVLFVFVVSVCTCLLGSLFFVYKWFSALNYIIGRKLFKVPALTAVWLVLIGIGVWAMLIGSVWLLLVGYLGHVALAAYLMSQLKKSRVCSSATGIRLKWYSRSLFMLWSVGAIWIQFGCISSFHWFVLAELCLIQKCFNLVIYDVSEDRTSLDAKIAADWHRLRLVVTWGAIVLSVLLFFWDVGVTVVQVLGMKSGTYHGFALDGRFHFWLFFETYSPHAAWQLYLWCLAALMRVVTPDALKRCRDAFTGTFNRKTIGEAFAAMFPTISNKQEVEA